MDDVICGSRALLKLVPNKQIARNNHHHLHLVGWWMGLWGTCCGGREMLLPGALIEFIYHTLFYGHSISRENGC